MSDLFVIAGETSGDLHGHNLVKELKKLDASLSITGVAGPKMRTEGVKPFMKMEEFQVMGFTDVIANLPGLVAKFYKIRDQILKENPKAVVFIDYPGLNLRLAKSLREKGYHGRLIHYICPSVWAWGKGRIDHMSKYLDKLLTIYPFEKTYFDHTSLPVDYIGNPLVETIQNYTYDPDWRAKSGMTDEQKRLISIFPGSRTDEIHRNLKTQLEAARLIKERLPDSQFALSITSPKIQAAITPYLSGLDIKVWLIPSTFNYELMQDSWASIAKSGTITLELALHSRPTVCVYGLSKLNRFVARHILRLKLPHFCIVNILANKTVFPECIKDGFDPAAIAEKIIQFQHEPETYSRCQDECLQIKEGLGSFYPSQQAARTVYELCKDD